MKKVVVGFTVFILLAAVGYLLYYFHSNRQYAQDRCIDVVPEHSVAIVYFHSTEGYNDWLQTNTNMATQLGSIPIFEALPNFQLLDSLKSILPTSLGELFNRQICLYYFADNDSLRSAFCIECINRAEGRAINQWFRKHCTRIKKFGHINCEIFQSNNLFGSPKWYLTIADGRLLFGSSIAAIEASLTQLESGQSLKNSVEFQSIRKTTGSTSPGHLYIQTDEMARFLGRMFQKPDAAALLGNAKQWAGVDFDFIQDQISFSGFLASSNQNNGIDRLLSGLTPESASIYDVFPSNTKYFVSYQAKFQEKQFLSNMILAGAMTSKITETLVNLMDGEMALIHCLRPDTAVSDRLLIIKTHSQGKALSELSQILNDSIASLEPIAHYSPDNVTNIPIYNGFSQGELSQALQGVFKDAPGAFFSIFNNYLVFGESVDGVSRFLNYNLLDLTLGNNPGFREFLSGFPVAQNYLMYIAPEYISTLLYPLVDDQGAALLQKNAGMSSFDAFGLQMSAGTGPLYVNSVLHYNPVKETVHQTTWQRQLSADAIGKPMVVKNHQTNQSEVIVQDATHQLYLINSAGIILWKKALDGPILGEITQIDFFSNGKFQYAFNTAGKLYLIDRNGNHLPNFPVSFQVTTVQGAAVLDYENTHDYRFFVVCKDRTVQLLNKMGNVIPDWAFKQTENTCVSAPQHFVVNGKDYLIFSDSGRHYFLDRRGQHRFSLSEEFQHNSQMPFACIQNGQKSFFVTFSSSGQMVKIAVPTGIVELKSVGFLAPPLAMKSLGRDSEWMAVVDSTSLYLVDGMGEIKWQVQPGGRLTPNVDIYQFSDNDIRIGVVDQDSQIYLYASDGFICPGFPLTGIGRFDIGHQSNAPSHLIVGGKSGLLYNYPLPTIDSNEE